MVNYNIGIDVGAFSVGLAAIEIDDNKMPVKILAANSIMHDSGVDPTKNKTSTSRKAVAGQARRMRRLIRQRRKRLKKLDQYIESKKWPIADLKIIRDPYYPWRVRAQLATEKIADKEQLHTMLSIALRHMARHRGWRNPYQPIETLFQAANEENPLQPSADYKKLHKKVCESIGHDLLSNLTEAQLVLVEEIQGRRIRHSGSKAGLLDMKLRQSDHANELWKICKKQGLPESLFKEFVLEVFQSKSPKGAAEKLVGKDPLQPTKPRALKASSAFQEYRIACVLGNLRIDDQPLSVEQRQNAFEYLLNASANQEVSWVDVAEVLGVERRRLKGTATLTEDGERPGNKPPVNETARAFEECDIKKLRKFWLDSDETTRRILVSVFSNSEETDFDSPEGAFVEEFITAEENQKDILGLLSGEESSKKKLHIPFGRAAYSENTLRRITNQIINEGTDLHEARIVEFGIADDWRPPKPDVGEPVGNPSVDRVLKIVSRWLQAAEAEWGKPARINIEHVRDGFTSKKKIIEAQRERTRATQKLLVQLQEERGIVGRVSRRDILRHECVKRQNSQCAYCGETITFDSCELDHIVPRAGLGGSTNKRENLVATCHRCNLSKSNIPFAVWATNCGFKGVSLAAAKERVDHWLNDSGLTKKDFAKFQKAVKERLDCDQPDPEYDNRSIESVAWMANELRARVAQKYGFDHADDHDTKVNVYAGQITAQARKASGISRNLRMIGGEGKTRFDRRHHAIDAAVVAMLLPGIVETLTVQETYRRELYMERGERIAPEEWQVFSDTAHEIQFKNWRERMKILCELLQEALDEDQIPVFSYKRLRIGNSIAHKDTVRPLTKVRVGDELPVSLINHASTPALWCALTRHPDFDPQTGLPADPERVIRLQGKWLTADDTIGFFPDNAPNIILREGYAAIGDSYHHARFYKIPRGKKTAFAMMKVYNCDLLNHRKEDVFSVELPAQSISRRYCDPKLNKAIADGTAEYLGWAVTDDEIWVDISNIDKGIGVDAVKELDLSIFRWRIDGFPESTIRIRPSQLSEEGIDGDSNEHVLALMKNGWRVSANVLLSQPGFRVVRRDTLGRERVKSNNHMPVCWEV